MMPHASWVTVFNGARDRYQVAVALAERDLLETLVTDWYSPLDHRWAAAALHALPRTVRATLARRYAAGLPSGKVQSMPAEVLRQAARVGTLDAMDARMGRHAGRLALRRGAGILAYNYYAHAAFAAYGNGSREGRALFQVQAHPSSLRAILEREATITGQALDALGEEPELTGSARLVEELCEVPLQADVCIVPSTFAGATLAEHGVEQERVRVVPYGVDLSQFTASTEPHGAFRVLFVGQLTQRKGLRYLLEAWRRLALPNAELHLVGRGQVDHALLSRYAGIYTVEMNVHSRDRMRALYQSAHVFCMPSLVESFGLVYLEALACGTPIIATSNTGAPDLITNGREGFIVPPHDEERLREQLAWCHAHRDELAAMRAPAREAAERFPWRRFRAGVVDAISDQGEPDALRIPAEAIDGAH